MNRFYHLLSALVFIFVSCSTNKEKFDASGIFEVTEVIVSSEIPGKITALDIREGDTVSANSIVGKVDASNILLQQQQVEASIGALSEKTADVSPQVKLLENQLAVQQSQVENLEHEKARIERLFKQDAATGKQVDDISYQLEVARKQLLVTKQQINVQRNNVSTQNRSILSETKPLEKRVALLQDQVQRANIINPVTGTVITKYAEAGELTSTGKAIYKVADMKEMILRAYITGNQLSQVKLNQQVKVFVDNGPDKYREYTGVITWISDKAEFTPKTIQTKDERANLVYAIKINVKNDGFLKIGMYGEVRLN